jgi:phosphatidylglycerophosphatase C
MDKHPCLTVFDLDGTLTRNDTYLPYLLGFLIRHPWRFARVVSLPWSMLLSFLGWIDNTELKQRFLGAFLAGTQRRELERWTQSFLNRLIIRDLHKEGIRTLEAHRQNGDTLVLLTASLDLYVEQLGAKLGFHHVICTKTEWKEETLSGKLSSPNRYGEEKAQCLKELKEQYAHLSVVAYADHHSDISLLTLADHGILVNGTTQARQLAVREGIPRQVWR